MYMYICISLSPKIHIFKKGMKHNETIGQRNCASAVAASARIAGAEVLSLTSHSIRMPGAHDLGIWGLWRSLN